MSPAIEATRRGAWAERARSYLADRSNLAFVLVLLLVVSLHLVNFFATMFISPLGFDEAFNLQAPLNLVQGNGYASEDWLAGGPKLLFDAIVSTGPIVEVPVALSFLVFGTTIEAARIVMLPYLILLGACLFVLGKRFAGRWGGLAAVATLLAIDSRADWPNTVIYGPSDALGEYAAAALLALALVLLPKYRALAGLAIGFAALAKFIAFLAAPAFLIAMLLVPVVAGIALSRRQRIREIVLFIIFVAAPSLVWELVKFVSLGFPAYLEVLTGYLRFVFRSGSGVDGGFRAFFLDRGSRLFAAWHLPTLLIILLSVLLFAFAVIGITRYWADTPAASMWSSGSRLRALPPLVRTLPVELVAAAGMLAVFVLWWCFISSSIFVRHTMPVLLATVPLIVALSIRGAQSVIASPDRKRRVFGRTVVAGLVVTMATQTAFTLEAASRAEEWTRGQQVAAADFIRSLDVENVQGAGWWASPELRFLSHVPSQPLGTGTGPLVIQPILRTLDPASYDVLRALCVDVLYEEDGFIVCTVSPDQGPTEIGS